MPRRIDSCRPRRAFLSLLIYFVTVLILCGCSRVKPVDSSSLTFLIESNPANLDPRFATDAQSQHIDGLLFSSLVERGTSSVPCGSPPPGSRPRG